MYLTDDGGLWTAEDRLGRFFDFYDNVRLHSAIGYIAPRHKLQGRSEAVFAARHQKLPATRERRERRFAHSKSMSAASV